MNKKFFVFFIITIIIILIIAISINVFGKTNNNDLNNKTKEEIRFIEGKLIGMINSLNNVSFSNTVLLEQNSIKGQSIQNNSETKGEGQQSESQSNDSSKDKEKEEQSSSSQEENNNDYTRYNVENRNILIQNDENIDWNYIKTVTEVIYSTWPTIMIDLHSVNVKNEDITNFSKILDTLVVSIQKEDKKETLTNLTSLYQYVPIYIEQITDNSKETNIAHTKACVINAYKFVEEANWGEMQKQVEEANQYFGLIINSVDDNNNQINISKTYIAINEMKNAINLKDKKLFYLKYINLMESAMEV